MTARNGKIARLPRSVRMELNERLERSEPGPDILAWLNGLPEVKELLAQRFDGQAISKQNLSQWRRGGFQEWLILNELRDSTDSVEELAGQVDSDDALYADKVAKVLAVHFGSLLINWNGQPDARFEAKARALNGLARGIAQLQRTLRKSVDAERAYSRKLEEDDERMDEKLRQTELTFITSLREEPLVSKLYGGGKRGDSIARYISELKCGIPEAGRRFGERNRRNEAEERESPQGKRVADNKPKNSKVRSKSNPVKADQSAQSEPTSAGPAVNLKPQTDTDEHR